MSTEYPGPISLGDLVRACCELKAADTKSIDAIAGALDFRVGWARKPAIAEGEQFAPQPPLPLPSGQPSSSKPELPSPEMPAPPAAPPAPPASSHPPTQLPPTGFATVEPVKSDVQILEQAKGLQPVNPVTAHEGAEEFPPNDRTIPLPPLFDPGAQSSILAELVATNVRGHRVDLMQLIKLLARGRPPNRLPFVETRLVSFGCQLLVDTGTGMDPFALDRLRLLTDLRSIVPDDRLYLHFFRDCPTSGVEDPVTFDVGKWAPPVRRCPVIVVTEFGIDVPPDALSSSTHEDWVGFAEDVRRHRLPLAFLVPCPLSKVPRALRQRAAVITWDRQTRVRDVRRFRTGRTPGKRR